MSESSWRRLRRLWRPTIRDEVDDEVAFHMQMRIEQFVAAGMAREAAERAARERFGDVGAVQSALVRLGARRRRRLDWRDRLEAVRMDAVVSLRALRREPLFTAGVVLTLALGIGANATMFGIIDGLMLRGPAHVVNAAAVRRLYVTADMGPEGVLTMSYFGYATYAALRDRATSFAGVGAYLVGNEAAYGVGARARPVHSGHATWDLFPTLGVHPVIGRFFSRDEDSPPNAANVVVISQELWQSEFGGSRSALGKRVTLDRAVYTIIGVAPAGFTGPERIRTDVWLPMTLVHPVPNWTTSYRAQWLRVVARLAPGVSPEHVGAEATTILRAAYTGEEPGMRRLVASFRPLWFGRTGEPSAIADVSRWLMGVALVVLLVTCANVANLLIARARRRRREVAVRIALGVGRARLLRLVLVETLLVVLAGACAALGVAIGGGRIMRATLLSNVAWDGTGTDARTIAFTLSVALVAGILVALAPATQATRANHIDGLKAGAGDGGGRRARLRVALSALQAALCVILLVGAGLFVESLARSRAVDLGFQPERVIRAYPEFSLAGLTGDALQNAKARNARTLAAFVTRLRAMPWVERATLSVGSPFGFGFSGITLKVPGRDSIPDLPGGGPYVTAAFADYFATMGTPLRQGRVFTAADRDGSAPVVIVNETMAKTLWPGESALGKCIEIGDPPAACASVVGVVGDVHRYNLREPPAMQYYVPFGQERGFGGTSLLVRPRGDPEAAMPLLQQALRAMPGMPYTHTELMEASLDPQYRPWRLGATMFGIFGLLALVIAAVGLYSVIAYLVADRTRELGLRIALGAPGGRIIREVVQSGMGMTAIGVAIGIGIALLAGRFIEPLLFDVNPRDPVIVTAVAVVVLAIGAVAAWWPARRAAQVDPVIALRVE